jgi:hypothetical protein
MRREEGDGDGRIRPGLEVLDRVLEDGIWSGPSRMFRVPEEEEVE